MTGENTTSEQTPARYGQGVASQRRSRGDHSRYSRTEGTRNAAVYLESMAAPSAAPAASHQPPRRESRACQTSVRVRLQKNSTGESGKPQPPMRNAAGCSAYKKTAHNAAASP